MPTVTFCGCPFCDTHTESFRNGTAICSNGHTYHLCDVHDQMIISGPRTTLNGTCSCHTADTHMFVLQSIPKPGTSDAYVPAEIARHNSLYARWEMANKRLEELRDEIDTLIHRRRLAQELERLVTRDPNDAEHWVAILGRTVKRVQNEVKDLGSTIEDRGVTLGKVYSNCQSLATEANALRMEIQNKYHAQVKEITV